MNKIALILAVGAVLAGCSGGSSSATSGTTGSSLVGLTAGSTGSGATGGTGFFVIASASSTSSGTSTGVGTSTGQSGSTSGTTGSSGGGSATGACVPGSFQGGVPPGAIEYDGGGSPPGDCAPDGVCRFPPSGFRDAVGFSATDIWAVDGNAVYHLSGATWKLVFGGLGSYAVDGGTQTGPNPFTAIWGSGDNDLWVGNTNFCSAILHYDGTSWLQVPVAGVSCGESFTFDQSFGFGPDDAWMTVKQAPVLHWDGCAWSSFPGAPTGAQAVWGLSSSDLWVGGDTQAPNLHHWDGMTWTSYTNPAAATQNGTIYGIWGASSTDVWAVGDDATDASWGTILHWDGHSWTQIAAPAAIYPLGVGIEAALVSVWGSSSTDVYMGAGYPGVAGQGGMLHYDGKTWTVVDLPWVTGGAWNGGIPHGINRIWGSGPSNIYAFGENGAILYYNGVSWTYVAGITGEDLLGIWSSAPNDAWAVSSDATAETVGGLALMHYDGNVWNTVSEFTSWDSGVTNRAYSNLTGNSDTDLWVGGFAGAFHWDGTQITFNGNGIEQFNGGPSYPTFYGVFQDTATNLWMVGENGIIYQGSGVSSDTIGFNCVQNSIAPYYSMSKEFHSVHGLHGGPLYIVGDYYKVGSVAMDAILVGDTAGGARTNCAGNCCMEGFTNVSIVDPAWADGGGYGPAQFNAVFVVPQPTDATTPADVWIAGYQDTTVGEALPYVIHSTDQETWVQVPVPDVGTAVLLTGIWAASDSDIWFVGEDYAMGQGWLYHWDGKSISFVARPDPGVEGNYAQVWGTSSTDVWAAGTGATIVHYSGL